MNFTEASTMIMNINCKWRKKILNVLITFTGVCVAREAIHSTGSVHLCGAHHFRAHWDSVAASYVPGTALAPAHHHSAEVQRARQALALLRVQEVSSLLFLPHVGSAARRRYREFPRVCLEVEISNTEWSLEYWLHPPGSLSGHRLSWSLLLSPPQPDKTDSFSCNITWWVTPVNVLYLDLVK